MALKTSPVIPKYLAWTLSIGICLLLIRNTSKTKVLSWFAHRYIVWNFLPLEKMKIVEAGERMGGTELGQDVGEKNRGEKEAFLATDTL